MDLDALTNLIAWLESVPMPAETLAEVKGAAFMAAAGFQAKAPR